ncbi:flagellar hook capping FlgD N-terminal domain-containing protein [Paenisporosarcina sp. TG-14]|uniref:flagellar hook capping FlgD N-terminal domain-containing protein n=1 Tax=Paenisporosarcina sp. TG-14 TaxID=1231057 RepID=UPI0002E61801|nr:flagellar hook capping FlgD N-terminal domain-containing protein [Paenisporosarcina sp. TG-14]
MNVSSSNSVNTQQMAANKQPEQQNALGQDAFMKILVTQMKHQNPLEPIKDTEFIGQMAQFSSLEQLSNLNQTMTQFIQLQGKQPLTEHAHLIGNTVHWEQEINGQLQSGQGIVKALAFSNGELLAEIGEDNIKVPIDSIHRIEKTV